MSDLDPSTAALQQRAALRKAQDDAKFWRDAAWLVGEHFPGPMPDGYYQMSPQEWEEWAKKTVAALLARIEELEGFLSVYQNWES